MEKNEQPSFIAGLKWSTIGGMGLAIFQLLQVSILTRFLPKEAFGLVAMALFVVRFSSIFVDMGFTSAIIHKLNISSREYSSIYWFNLLISILIFLLIWSITPLLSDFYEATELRSVIPILATNIVILAIGRVHRTILQKEFRFKAMSIIDLLSYFIGLISAVILATNNFGLYSLIYSTLIASTISSSLFLIMNVKKNPIHFHFREIELKPFLKIGSFSMGSQFISFFSTDFDILIVGKMLGPANLGIYSLAKQIVLKLYALINPIFTKILTPLMAAMQNNESELKSYFLKITRILTFFNIPLYLLVFIASKEILIFLYGQDYAEANYVLGFLAIAYCTYSINNPVGSLQIATGRTDIGFKWAIFSLIITPVAIYFASYGNVNTVAVVRAILGIVMIIPLWFIQLKPMANIHFKEYINQFLKPLLFLLLISGAFMFLSQYYELPFGIVINGILKGVIGLSVFAVLLWIFDRDRVLETYSIILLQLKINKK